VRFGKGHTFLNACLGQDLAQTLRSWHHSGFQVWAGRPVVSDDLKALEQLCACILRPSFAGIRLEYDDNTGQIKYQTTKGVDRSMNALEV